MLGAGWVDDTSNPCVVYQKPGLLRQAAQTRMSQPNRSIAQLHTEVRALGPGSMCTCLLRNDLSLLSEIQSISSYKQDYCIHSNQHLSYV